MNELKVMLDTSIEAKEFGTIYFPKIIDLMKLEDMYSDDGSLMSIEEQYQNILVPFRLTPEILKADEETKKQVKCFDLMFIKFKNEQGDEYTYLKQLMDSLEFFFKLKPFYNEAKYSISIGDYVIDRCNYDLLCNYILDICNSKKIVIEPEPVFKNERQRDVYMKCTQGRKRLQEKQGKFGFVEVIRCVSNGKETIIPYSQIIQMTVRELFDRYYSALAKDNWDINFGQCLAGADSKNLDLTHWVIRFKDIGEQD